MMELEDIEFAVVGKCIGCGKCIYVCAQQCIDDTSVPYSIDPTNCIGCGACAEVCPVNAISRL